jgi:hypothetical protein
VSEILSIRGAELLGAFPADAQKLHRHNGRGAGWGEGSWRREAKAMER